MNLEAVEKIARAVLYEGYMLYPYRPSSAKNRQRWTFGTLYPPNYEGVRAGSEGCNMHVECLLAGNADAAIQVRLNFLHLLDTGEVVERCVNVEAMISAGEQTFPFQFGAGALCGTIASSAETLPPDLFKLSVDVTNTTALPPAAARDEALLHSLLSAHALLAASNREFVSQLDPPPQFREAVRRCRNVGCFPVLAGEPGRPNIMLCSPIILYDYPQVAPESAGDFFDATEIDELLTLRVMTLTDEEKRAMGEADERLRALLERTEASAREQLMRTHGVIRSLRPVNEEQ